MDQAFLRSEESAPRPPPSSHSRPQHILLSQSSCVLPVELADGRGNEKGGRGAKSYDHEIAWPFINHSILSDADLLITKFSNKFTIRY